jgi:hypothetical protein
MCDLHAVVYLSSGRTGNKPGAAKGIRMQHALHLLLTLPLIGLRRWLCSTYRVFLTIHAKLRYQMKPINDRLSAIEKRLSERRNHE